MTDVAAASDERRFERRVVLWSLAAVTFAVLAVGSAGDLIAPKVSRIELTRRCLVNERGFLVYEATLPPALEADDGALQTTIETNDVTFALVGSDEEAQRLARAFSRLEPPGYVEASGRIVYRWNVEPSPTQRQAAYNCTY